MSFCINIVSAKHKSVGPNLNFLLDIEHYIQILKGMSVATFTGENMKKEETLTQKSLSNLNKFAQLTPHNATNYA